MTPTPDGRLLESEDAEGDPGGDQCQAPVVQTGRTMGGGDVGEQGQDHGQHGDGNIDPEDSPPGPRSQDSAQHRPHGREGTSHAEEERQRLTSLTDRETAHHDRQRRRVHHRSANALQHSERHDPDLAQASTSRSEPAQRRGRREQHHPDDHRPAMPERVGQPSTEREKRSHGENVAFTAQWIPSALRPRSCWICEATIETIVWSMNVIDTAKIIATSTRYFDRTALTPTVVTTGSSRSTESIDAGDDQGAVQRVNDPWRSAFPRACSATAARQAALRLSSAPGGPRVRPRAWYRTLVTVADLDPSAILTLAEDVLMVIAHENGLVGGKS